METAVVIADTNRPFDNTYSAVFCDPVALTKSTLVRSEACRARHDAKHPSAGLCFASIARTRGDVERDGASREQTP